MLNQGLGHGRGRMANKDAGENRLKPCLNLVNSSMSFMSFCSMPRHKILTPIRDCLLNPFSGSLKEYILERLSRTSGGTFKVPGIDLYANISL